MRDTIVLYNHTTEKIEGFSLVNPHLVYSIRSPSSRNVKTITRNNIDSFIQEQVKVMD